MAYEVGGILKAISSKGKAEEKNISSDILSNLFTPAENDSEFETFVDDLKDAYINKEDSAIDDKRLVRNGDSADAAKLKELKKKNKKQKESPERLGRTLFVGNVSIDTTKKVLIKMFKKFGGIESIRFRSFTASDVKVPKKVALIKKQFRSECKSMNAYIVYENKESVDKALICNGMNLEGLHIRVDKVSQEKKYDNRTSIFVGNLPFNIDEETVREHFQQCGVVENIRLIRDKASGLGKGFGYIRFDNSDGVVFGLKLNGSNLNGRQIRVCHSVNRGSAHAQSGKNNNDLFRGLKSTSKKEREVGKKFIDVGKFKTYSNAMRRIKNKSATQKKLSSTKKRKEQNLKKKMRKSKE